MAEPRRRQVEPHLLVQARHVADDQAGQQPALVVRQHVARLAQTGAQRSGGPLHGRGRADRLGRPPDEHHRRDRFTLLRRAEPPAYPDPLAGQQRTPSFRGTDQHDGHVHGVSLPGGRHQQQPGPDDRRLPPGHPALVRPDARVVADLRLGGHRGAPAGQVRHGSGRHLENRERRDRGRHGHGREHRHRDPGGGPRRSRWTGELAGMSPFGP